jgi:hypothetical protein
VADGVDAAVAEYEPASIQAAIDGSGAQPRIEEL